MSLLAVAAMGAFASNAYATSGGNFIATGHDMDLHCTFNSAAECSYLKIAVDKVRNGSTLPILALDQGSYYVSGGGELPSALARVGEGPVVTVNPTSSAFATMPFVDSSGHPLYSAIITASDSTCGGCDNTPAGESAINARASDFATFFNGGGGILAQSGASNNATYYNFVPLHVGGIYTYPPYSVTAAGAALGITNNMANCCATHNSFATVPSGLQALETDQNGHAETLAAFNATITTGGGGGGGFSAGDQKITASGSAVSATEGQTLSGVKVATFTDPDTGATASEYSASIAWGDGSTSTGTVVANGGGGFSVTGSHTYAQEGSYTVKTTITDSTDSTNTATASSAATVADAALTAGQLTVNGGTEGTQPTSASFAFTDANPGATVSDYAATIKWGDGTTSTGTVSANSSGGFSVDGSHTYAEEGSSPVSVTVNDAGGQSTSASGYATVADAALTASGKTLNSTPGFSGTVATFTDADPNGTASDYAATIDWGDGTVTPGTIDGSFNVNGSHTYAATGPYTIKVHVADAGGSTADATTQILVYAFAAGDGGSFVIGDGNAAIGSQVDFWGSQWAKDNSMSSGSAPSAFKGFADGVSSNGPSCGGSYTTGPGNSSAPPSAVPPYMGVFVSSAIAKHGPTLAGDIGHIVVVQTDPGYQADPGHPGTGKVVAVVC